ncbi:hypothetical protein SK128_015062 [Halocaridina rubra]|uniref:Brix domain-containing protein n=1 Tax=Halocaridina rubra TaxID=373956 RepID=A0AAN8X6F6_HALRR
MPKGVGRWLNDVEEEGEEGEPVETKPSEDDEEMDPIFPVMGPGYGIKNKFLKRKKFKEAKVAKMQAKIEKARERFREKKAWRKAGNTGPPPTVKKEPTKLPHTIESLREPDLTYVEKDDDELAFEEATDKYAKYYEKAYEPKVLITSSYKLTGRTMAFISELRLIIPNSEFFFRRGTTVKKMVLKAVDRGFTDILVINEDRRWPNGFLLIHLPDGPAAYFRLTNPRICKDIRRTRSEITSHRPEVILNNFKTRLGQMIARMLGALFHYEPEFKGRRVCTFHNQRDFIFFRHHRYEFESSKRVNLRELGPRFTLRLQWLQDGAFDGDYEWVLKRHEMESSRRRFHL